MELAGDWWSAVSPYNVKQCCAELFKLDLNKILWLLVLVTPVSSKVMLSLCRSALHYVQI